MDGDRSARKWVSAACVTVSLGLLAAALLGVAIQSLFVHGAGSLFVPGAGAPHVSAGDFTSLFADRRFRESTANTLAAAGFTTILSLILGFILAFLAARTDMSGQRFWRLANLAPLFLSPYAGAIAWTYLLAPHDGMLSTLVRDRYGTSLGWLDIYSLPGVIFILTLFHTPIVYLFLVPPLRDMDAAYEDTARVHGATFWATLRHITLPVARPALVSAALVVFVTSAGLFDVPAALGAPRGISFIPTEIYAMARSPADLGRAAAFSIVVLIAWAGLAAAWYRLPRGPRAVARGVKAYPIRAIHLRWPARAAAVALHGVYLGCTVLLPLVVLSLAALSREWDGRFEWRTATGANFEYVLAKSGLTRAAIGDSLIIGVLGATIGVGLAVAQTWYLTHRADGAGGQAGTGGTGGGRRDRGGARHRAWIEYLLALPFGIPAVFFGLGFLILALGTPMHGTIGVILLACIAGYTPVATRNIAAGFRAIDPGLEHAARTSGADWRQTAGQVLLPLMRPSLLAAWLMLFVILVREFGASVLLYARGNQTISVALLMLSDREPGYVAALALVQMVMLLLAFALFGLVGARLTERPA